MSLDGNRKRARSEDEKQDRRAAILAEARAYVGESGFDSVTMAELARRSGLAKGTLYLYFRTREELMLSLFRDSLTAVIDAFVATATRDTIPEALTNAATGTPLFLPLFARLVAVIEANVTGEPLFEAKRALNDESLRFNARLAQLLGRPPEQAAPYTDALIVAMQGAAQFDLTARRDTSDLPADLRPVFAAHAFAAHFPSIARTILASA